VPKNVPESIRLYEKSAAAGEALAQIRLARIYLHGSGVPIDRERAHRWYSAVAAQEEALGDCEELLEAQAYLAKL